MKIHEYQAKEIFAQYGIMIPQQALISSADEAAEVIRSFAHEKMVVKAQVQAGGRGKAGGVKLVSGYAEAEKSVRDMLGMRLITVQSGTQGIPVNKVLLTETINIAKEYYLSLTVDNGSECLMIIASEAGGTEIEELAKNDPEQIIKLPVSLAVGYQDYHGREIARLIHLPKPSEKQLIAILRAMFKLFCEKNCSLIEINPLVLTTEGDLCALDAKMNFDDNALMLHPEISVLRDITEEDSAEWEAAQAGLSYVSLSGNIGCLVNGAGLAMATMDIIKSLGGEPANFLDVGGSASVEKVTTAFRILFNTPGVKVILVNIFGGIMKCDVIAAAIIEAAASLDLSLPLVVRLEGTNVEIAKEMLSKTNIPMITANDLGEAAAKAVTAARGGEA